MDSGASAENPALHARPWNKFRFLIDSSFLPLYMKQDRKSTRLNSKSPVHLVCRLLLEKKNLGEPLAASSVRIFASFFSSRTSTTMPSAMIGERPLRDYPALTGLGILHFYIPFPARV